MRSQGTRRRRPGYPLKRFSLKLVDSCRKRPPSSPYPLAVPLDRLLEPHLEPGPGPEAEMLLGSRRVEEASRLTVGLARIPDDLPFESGEARDQSDEVLDRDLDARPEIHRFIALVSLGREHDPFGGIGDIEEFASGLPGAPHRDGLVAGFDSVHAFLDQRRDDM